MTANKHFKQLVRARMAATAETYTVARERLLAAESEITLAGPVVAEVHGRHGQTVAFSPDGTRLLSGGQDARIAVLDAASGRVEGELTGHDKVVNAVAFGAHGRTVVSVSSDRRVRVWDLDALSAVSVLEGHRDAVVALDVSPDGRHALTGGYDGRLRRWDLAEAVCVQETRSDLRRIAAVVHTPDGTLTAESGQGPRVYVRAAGSGELVTALDTGSPGVLGLAVAPDGGVLATAGHDGTLALWSCDTWERVRTIAAGERVNAVCFSRSGRLLAAAVRRRLVVWSHRSETPVATVQLPIDGAYALALSPDARRLAQTGADGRVRIWTLR